MTYSGPAGTLVSAGSLPVTFVPSGLTPLPQSGRHSVSDFSCGPYFSMLKPHV